MPITCFPSGFRQVFVTHICIYFQDRTTASAAGDTALWGEVADRTQLTSWLRLESSSSVQPSPSQDSDPRRVMVSEHGNQIAVLASDVSSI